MSNEDTICKICYEAKNLIIIADCSHQFCKSCTDKWLKINNTCPLCRRIINRNILSNYQKISDYENQVIYTSQNIKLKVTVNNYIFQDKMKTCLNNNHHINISKPYGVIISCFECQKKFMFNWLR